MFNILRKTKVRESLTNQENRVFHYIQNHGKINPSTSWNMCGVYRLSAVIHNLKAKGYPIKSERKPIKNKFGERVVFAEYTFDKDEK